MNLKVIIIIIIVINKNISLIHSLTLKGTKGLTEWTLRKQLFRDATMEKLIGTNIQALRQTPSASHEQSDLGVLGLAGLGSIFTFILNNLKACYVGGFLLPC